MFGVAQNQYNVQTFLHWDDSMEQTFYGGGAYATSFGASYKAKAFTSTADTYTPVIVSITNGEVVIKNVDNANWNPQAYTFYAW